MKTTTQNIIGILNIGIKRMALTALAVAGFATSANAAVILSSAGGGGASAPEAQTLGYRFIVGNTSLTVSDLGFFDTGTNGLANAHAVGIWGGSTLLASGTVPSGTTGTLVGNWRYVAITPITLTNNTQYTIGGLYPTGNTDSVPGQSGNVQTNGTDLGIFSGGWSFNTALTAANPAYNFEALWVTGASLARPTNLIAATGQAYPAPNFQYTLVPEPSTLAMAVVGGLGMLVSLRRKRRTN